MSKEKTNSMKLSVLASSSKGNVTYIEKDSTKLLIDVGMSCNYIEEKLKELEINPKDIDAILVSHTHADHINGLRAFYKKYKPLIYITKEMQNDLDRIQDIEKYEYFCEKTQIKDINIEIIHLSHDAEDTIGFIIDDKVVYITDTGYINVNHFDVLRNKAVYIFESNHDIEMLRNGPYPFYLQQRILSDKGHLSNHDSAYYISNLVGNNTKYIVLAHLSEKSNTEELAYKEHNNLIDRRKHKLIIAKPKEKTDLIEV